MKKCNVCEVEKPLSAFRDNNRMRCRQCSIRIATRQRDERQLFSYDGIRRWSALDNARLLTLYAIGVPLKEAAHLVGRPVDGTRAQLTKLKQTLFNEHECLAPAWTPDRIAVLREMIGIKGFSRSQAAKQLGVTKNAVVGATRRHLPDLCGKGERLPVFTQGFKSWQKSIGKAVS